MSARFSPFKSALSFALTVACLGALPTPRAAAFDQQSDLNRVTQLHRQGEAARERERANPADAKLHAERIKIYDAARAAQNSYVAHWARDPRAPGYLENCYRLNYYRELSDDFTGARSGYGFCLSQTRNDTSADAQKWRAEIQGRRDALSQAATSGKQRLIEVSLSYHSVKGLIFIKEASGIMPPAPLSEEEAQQVAARLSYTTDPEVALAVGRGLLKANPALLPYNTATEDSLVVFAVHGSPAEAQTLAQSLGPIRRALTQRYFDAADKPPVVNVYANLQRDDCDDVAATRSPQPGEQSPAQSPAQLGEQSPVQQSAARQAPIQSQAPSPRRSTAQRGQGQVGGGTPSARQCASEEEVARLLSQTLHFRAAESAEGYYQPLDNSIVLRKGLVSGETWFFGTGAHELVHALLRLDFPQAPLWLDEGMAAMHEEFQGLSSAADSQSRVSSVGQPSSGPLDNYRLYYLRAALDENKLPPLATVLNSDAPGWRGKAQPLLAATARYLCIYLAEKDRGRNLLKEVYVALRDSSRGADVRAADSLAAILRVTGMDEAAFEADFKAFIQGRDLKRLEHKWGSLRGNVINYVHNLEEASADNP